VIRHPRKKLLMSCYYVGEGITKTLLDKMWIFEVDGYLMESPAYYLFSGCLSYGRKYNGRECHPLQFGLAPLKNNSQC
jgi:hypothetical protein